MTCLRSVGAHLHADLGRDDDLAALAGSCQPFADEGFRFPTGMSGHPARIHVGSVDEIESLIHEAIEQTPRSRFIRCPAEHVAAKGQVRDFQAGTAQFAVFHCKNSFRAGRVAVCLSKLDGSADFVLPGSLLKTPWGIKSESPEAAQMQMQMRARQLAALIEQGYIQREGASIKSSLGFSGGAFTVNGKGFYPRVLQAQVAQPSQPVAPRQPGRSGPLRAR